MSIHESNKSIDPSESIPIFRPNLVLPRFDLPAAREKAALIKREIAINDMVASGLGIEACLGCEFVKESTDVLGNVSFSCEMPGENKDIVKRQILPKQASITTRNGDTALVPLINYADISMACPDLPEVQASIENAPANDTVFIPSIVFGNS